MPLPQQPAPSLTAEEQVVWTDAVDFYDRTIASDDLLFEPFDRAWPAYRDPIEQQVRPFVDGRITYEEMAANLARALREAELAHPGDDLAFAHFEH